MKNVTLIFLLFAIVLILTSCNKKETLKDTNDIKSMFAVLSEGISDFQIVRGEYASDSELEAAKYLRAKIKDIYGFTLPITDDFEKEGYKSNRREYEILVGLTNREESKTEKVKNDDYIIRFSDNKIVLTGGCGSACYNAVEYFIENYFYESGIYIPHDLNYVYNHNYIYDDIIIAGNSVSDFKIVYNENTSSKNAFMIQESIVKICGYRPETLMGYANTVQFNIYIGNTNTILPNEIKEAVSADIPKIEEIGFLIKTVENCIVIYGYDSAAEYNGVCYFIKNYIENTDISETEKNIKNIGDIYMIDNIGLTAENPAEPVSRKADIVFSVNTSETTGKIISNKLSIMNQWNYKGTWTSSHESNYFALNFPFVNYMQFMTATGGSAERDLFLEPENLNILDDYNFKPLIDACANVVAQGLKPFIKTGNIPIKYSSKKPVFGTFGVNIFEPADYNIYYNYIKALAQELVNRFGIEEVRSWKWGVFTEYENSDWFNTGEKSEDSLIAYCKIYDYTAGALCDVLGDNIYIGAHSMTCADGLWDEREFIRHCAVGTNYYTKKTGSLLKYLSISFYDINPSKKTSIPVEECIEIVRKTAKSYNLNLDYGIDEGRLLNGSDDLPLTSRVVGHTYQSAYDARLIKTMIDFDIDYFATWLYTTGNAFSGLKTVSHHVASCFYNMNGSAEVKTQVKYNSGLPKNTECDLTASYDEKNKKIYIMAYSFKYDMLFSEEVTASYEINLPAEAKSGNNYIVTRYLIDDTANFFDEWYAKNKNVPNTTGWSIDSAQILLPFDESEYEKYSVLIPTRGIADVKDNKINLSLTFRGNSAVFYVIDLSK